LKELADRYPNYSQADTALSMLARSLERNGPESSSADVIQYYSRIVRDYPLSEHVEEAKERLQALEAPVPQADPAAVARMTYEKTHMGTVGFWGKMMGGFHRRPNVAAAQGKLGPPTMTAQGAAQAGALPATSSGGTQPSSSTGSPPAIMMETVPPPSASGGSSSVP
jgi:hypothetical protein